MTSLDSVNSSNENRIDESTWTRTWINNNDIFIHPTGIRCVFVDFKEWWFYTKKKKQIFFRIVVLHDEMCSLLSARYSTTKFHPLCSYSACHTVYVLLCVHVRERYKFRYCSPHSGTMLWHEQRTWTWPNRRTFNLARSSHAKRH